MAVWREPFTQLRIAILFDLRADPYERADITLNTYSDWCIDHLFLNIAAAAFIEKFLATFKEYPPRQLAEGMDIQQTIQKLKQGVAQ